MTSNQHNLTITKDQKEFIEKNDGKMNVSKLAEMLGLSYNKVQHNRRVMGLVKPRPASQRGRVVVMEGYFDVDEFAHYYNF